MRIARYVVDGKTEFGIVELASDNTDHPDSVAAITGDPIAGPVRYTGERHALSDVRLLAPVIPRSKVIGIGRNYVEHAHELGNEVPTTPLSFLKPNTAVIGPGEPVVYPPESQNLHYEGELAVVIGRICRRVPAERVQDVIFGYTCANDVTARDLQKSDGQWTRGKGFDTFCPLGPWIVTHLSLEEAGHLEVSTTVNGVEKQRGSAELMVYPLTELIVHLSSFMTLLPGDVILTGTPAGVGPVAVGDEMSVTVSGIGTLTNPVAAETEAADAAEPTA